MVCISTPQHSQNDAVDCKIAHGGKIMAWVGFVDGTLQEEKSCAQSSGWVEAMSSICCKMMAVQ